MGQTRAGGVPESSMAGELRDAVHPGVVPEPVAGHADLAAAGPEQHGLIEIGPVLDLLLAGRLQTGERDRHHDNHERRTSVLAGDALRRQGLESTPCGTGRQGRGSQLLARLEMQ